MVSVQRTPVFTPAPLRAAQRNRVPPTDRKRGDGLERRPPVGTARRRRAEPRASDLPEAPETEIRVLQVPRPPDVAPTSSSPTDGATATSYSREVALSLPVHGVRWRNATSSHPGGRRANSSAFPRQPTHRLRQRPPGEDHRFPGGASQRVLQRPVGAEAVRPEDVGLVKLLSRPFRRAPRVRRWL